MAAPIFMAAEFGLVGVTPAAVISRHHCLGDKPGMWAVSRAGQRTTHAVVDDFGTLVEVA